MQGTRPSVITIACLMAWGSAWTPAMAASPGPLPPAADVDLAHDILRELIGINTTHEHGSTAAAQVIQQQLVAAGFPASDGGLIAPAAKATKGNVIVRSRAKSRDGKTCLPPGLFLGHPGVAAAISSV